MGLASCSGWAGCIVVDPINPAKGDSFGLGMTGLKGAVATATPWDSEG